MVRWLAKHDFFCAFFLADVEHRNSDSNEDTDNKHDDHELHEGETLLLAEQLHVLSPPFPFGVLAGDIRVTRLPTLCLSGVRAPAFSENIQG